MLLSNFTLGLNTRQASYLINPGESLSLLNVDTTSEFLRPFKKLDIYKDDKEYSPYIYEWRGNILDSDNYRTYLEYKDLLLWSEENNKAKKFNGTDTFNLGIVKPDSKPTVAENGDGNLNGTYQYCYTYYNSNDGTESPPSEYSDEITIEDKAINVDVLASDDAQVDKIRLYRIGGNLTEMTLVEEITNEDQTYTDNLGDTEVDGRILDSFNNEPPVEGMKQLIYHLGFFVGFKDDKLYWSKIGNPNYWPVFNYVDFEGDVTGVVSLQGALLIFLNNKTYIIQGTSPDVFVKYLLTPEQGCIDYKSINYIANQPVWVSNDGLCTTEGSNITVITRPKLDKISFTDIKASAVLDGVYYLLLNDGKVFVADSRFGMKFYYLQLDNISNLVQINTLDKILFYNSNDKHIYKFGQSENLEFSYKSPKLTDGSYTMSKWYQDIYINYSGDITLKVYIDDDIVYDKKVDKDNIKVPAISQRGKSIQFEITGTGEVYEIEYKVKGRENGK